MFSDIKRKKMKKTYLISFTLLLSFISIYSQQDVNSQLNPLITGVPSLTITPDSRAGGMGDVGAATTPDINSQYWNPAKYAFMESPAGVAISYTPWLSKLVSDINLGYVAGYWKFDDFSSVSGSLRYFSLGEINLTDAEGNSYGTAQPYEMALDAAYARKLSENWSAAVAFRYIRSDLNNGQNGDGSGEEMFPGNAFAADIATYYNTLIPMATGDAKLGLGLNISNIGSKISYDKNQTNLFIPTNMRLGGSFEYPFDDYNKISINADLNKLLVPTPVKQMESDEDFDARRQEYYQISPIAGIFKSFSDAPGGAKEELQEIMWSVGAEYAYNNQFFVRGGYFNESQFKGNRKYFTAGVGFKLNVFQLDASYIISAAQSNPLDQTLRFTLGFDLAGLTEMMR